MLEGEIQATGCFCEASTTESALDNTTQYIRTTQHPVHGLPDIVVVSVSASTAVVVVVVIAIVAGVYVCNKKTKERHSASKKSDSNKSDSESRAVRNSNAKLLQKFGKRVNENSKQSQDTTDQQPNRQSSDVVISAIKDYLTSDMATLLQGIPAHCVNLSDASVIGNGGSGRVFATEVSQGFSSSTCAMLSLFQLKLCVFGCYCFRCTTATA